jgi:hypothetical protein
MSANRFVRYTTFPLEEAQTNKNTRELLGRMLNDDLPGFVIRSAGPTGDIALERLAEATEGTDFQIDPDGSGANIVSGRSMGLPYFLPPRPKMEARHFPQENPLHLSLAYVTLGQAKVNIFEPGPEATTLFEAGATVTLPEDVRDAFSGGLIDPNWTQGFESASGDVSGAAAILGVTDLAVYKDRGQISTFYPTQFPFEGGEIGAVLLQP